MNSKRIKDVANARAKKAYECVKKRTENKGKFSLESYTSNVKKLPAMILNNGLANAMAFAYEKGNEWGYIIEDVVKWLKQDNCPLPSSLKTKLRNHKFMEWLLNLDSTGYRLVMREILNYLNWLRRFASAKLIEGKAKQNTEGSANGEKAREWR